VANKAFTFRLNPTAAQLEIIKSHGGAARWVWNQMLDANIAKYKAEQKFNFQFAMNKLVTELRSGTPWLSAVNSQILQQKNRDLSDAIARKISRKQAVGFPKFKSKHHNSDSFRVPQFFKISDKGIKLPKIDGWIKWKQHRKLRSPLQSNKTDSTG
jgi:putative transposase